MSNNYDNNNSGVLFKNDRKTNAKQPDYKGSVQADGQNYWLSAWIKQGKQGKFMSLALTLKDVATEREPQEPLDRPSNDIPF